MMVLRNLAILLMILLLQAPVPAACRPRKYKRATEPLSVPLGLGVTFQGLRVSAEMRAEFERILTRAANRIPLYRFTELQGEWSLEIVVHLEEQQQGYILTLKAETNIGRSILLYQSSTSLVEDLWRDADNLAATTLATLEDLVLYLIPPESQYGYYLLGDVLYADNNLGRWKLLQRIGGNPEQDPGLARALAAYDEKRRRRNRSRYPGGICMISSGLVAGVGVVIGGAVLTPKIEHPGVVTKGEARLLVLSGGLILTGYPLYALGRRMWDRWPRANQQSVIHAYNRGVLEAAEQSYVPN
jgi:hypothetical protein